MAALLQSAPLAAFTCLCEKCEDTCCRGWSMQVEDATLARYKTEAPELLASVESDPGFEDGSLWIMRKDAGGACVKFSEGRCGIHAERGESFLGDACHFYPRITRRFGEQVLMTAALSCPEITRLALTHEGEFHVPGAADRLPAATSQVAPVGLSGDEALAVHRAFLQAVDDPAASVETVFARIASVARSLPMLGVSQWPGAVPLYLRLADGRLPAPERDANDPFNLLHALVGLIVATHKPMSDRLRQTVADMEQALAVSLDWQNVLIHTGEQSLAAWRRVHLLWESEAKPHYDAVLKRYLKMQLSMAAFPFAGFGESFADRATILGVRLATIKLALACACGMHGVVLPQDIVVRIVQSVSRLLDHLADPAFSLLIYGETGWVREARLRGLLEAQ